MRSNRWTRLAAGSLAVVVAVAGIGGVVLARPDAEPKPPASRSETRQGYLDRLAANLGVTPERLAEAIRQTRQERGLDGARAAGRNGGRTGRASDPAVGGRQQAAPQEQGPPNRRELLMRLASLAGVSPEEFRRAVRDQGGVRPALEAFGVDEAKLLDSLAEMIRHRFDPAVAENRISQEQADQLARQEARRLLRRLNGLMPR